MRFALFRRTDTDPAHLDVRHGDQSFSVVLRRRPTARRITLRVSSTTGAIVLTLPDHAALADARRFADAHGGWIAARLARVPEPVALVDGAQIPFRGVPHRLVHWSSLRGRTLATLSAAGEPIVAVSCDAPHVGRRVKDFLKAEAKRDLAHAVARYTDALGVAAKGITIRDTKSRWGSCSVGGDLNFSWRLILAPPFVLDYLAAHEVAHLKEMNHSQRFWRILRDLCPRTDDAEHWLKRHGTDLYRFG
jgi:predicted metal-dependent hydrolase